MLVVPENGLQGVFSRSLRKGHGFQGKNRKNKYFEKNITTDETRVHSYKLFTSETWHRPTLVESLFDTV